MIPARQVLGRIQFQRAICNLGFAVEDIDAFHQEMIAKGVPCLQPPEVEDFGGKLAGYADPDGLPFWVNDKAKKS